MLTIVNKAELERMNEGKRGARYGYPDLFVQLNLVMLKRTLTSDLTWLGSG